MSKMKPVKLSPDEIVKALDLYEIVCAEIVCQGLNPKDFSNQDIAQRIIALWDSDDGISPIEQRKYALVVTGNEIDCLEVLFKTFRIEGAEPESIRRKLKEVLITERYS